jgi:crossover junction endodeoxyribonuclease RuvC
MDSCGPCGTAKGWCTVIYLGIDPGKSGAIAAIRFTESGPATCRLSETPADVCQFILDVSTMDQCFAIVEKVHAMPKQGVSSSFRFGQSFGWLQGVLDAYKIPYEFAPPQKWQRAMGCLTGGDKNVSKAAAQRLWPHAKITHAIADAMLIAEYCRRVKCGE